MAEAAEVEKMDAAAVAAANTHLHGLLLAHLRTFAHAELDPAMLEAEAEAQGNSAGGAGSEGGVAAGGAGGHWLVRVLCNGVLLLLRLPSLSAWLDAAARAEPGAVAEVRALKTCGTRRAQQALRRWASSPTRSRCGPSGAGCRGCRRTRSGRKRGTRGPAQWQCSDRLGPCDPLNMFRWPSALVRRRQARV